MNGIDKVSLLKRFLFEAFKEILQEVSYERVELHRTDDGFKIVEPEGRKLADFDDIKRMARNRRQWKKFFDEWGVQAITLKGLKKGGRDEYLYTRAFLDKYIGDYRPVVDPQPTGFSREVDPEDLIYPKGKTVPVVKGTPSGRAIPIVKGQR